LNKVLLCFLIVASCFLFGCWDRTEIEEIGFLIGVAFDPVENFDEEMERMQKEKKRDYNHLFKSTYQVAIPSALIQQEGGGSSEDPFFNITTTGMTNFKMVRQIAARRSRRLSFEHIKVMIINEELVRHEQFLEDLLDFYLRDHAMRRRTHILISKGSAEEILQDKLPLEEMPSLSIMYIRDNEDSVSEMLTLRNIGLVQGLVMGKKSFLLPRVIKGENGDFKVAGAAIFLGGNNQMIGWLGDEEVSAYRLIMGEYGNSIIETKYEGEPIVFESFGMDTIIKYERKEDRDIFNVEIRAEGSLGESWNHNIDISEEDIIGKIEQAFEQEIELVAKNIINKMQQEFSADIFEFNEKVRQKNNQYWKKNQDNWDGKDGMFSKAEVKVNAKVRIRHYMLNEKLS
jgi:spore germination protein